MLISHLDPTWIPDRDLQAAISLDPTWIPPGSRPAGLHLLLLLYLLHHLYQMEHVTLQRADQRYATGIIGSSFDRDHRIFIRPGSLGSSFDRDHRIFIRPGSLNPLMEHVALYQSSARTTGSRPSPLTGRSRARQAWICGISPGISSAPSGASSIARSRCRASCRTWRRDLGVISA